MDNYFNAKPSSAAEPYIEELSPPRPPTSNIAATPAAKPEPGRPIFPNSPASPSQPSQAASLSSKTVAQLKANLKSLGLSTSGRKAELVERLSSASAPSSSSSSSSSTSTATAATTTTPLPILLYLPGLDGTGLSASDQYPSLTSSFSVRRLQIPSADRTDFYGLLKLVNEYIRGLDEEVILVGESFGGLLAMSVAFSAHREGRLRGLVLVNPATSFSHTGWGVAVPLLTTLLRARTEVAYPLVASAILGLTVPSFYQSRKLASSALEGLLSDPAKILSNSNDLVLKARDGINALLAPDTLKFRVGQLLTAGSDVCAESRVKRLSSLKTLVMAGEQDKLLPSASEGRRLKSLLGPNCTLASFPKGSHLLLDGQVNLTSQILSSPIMRSKPLDPVRDFSLPPQEAVERIIDEQVGSFRRLASPLFFSTNPSGSVVGSLNYLPSPSGSRPILIVGNHQFGGLDLGLVVAETLEARGFAPRGLAHPVIFGAGRKNAANGTSSFGGGGGAGGGKGQVSQFKAFGAVEVSPRSFYTLMEENQATLLFPGGVREVFHGPGEEYKLFWPSDGDFVRTAAKFNATIVTLAGVGAYESSKVLASQQQLLGLPFLGEKVRKNEEGSRAAPANPSSQLRENSAKVPSARGDGSEEVFVPPVSVPKFPPARHYFLFGRPLETEGIDYRDREACRAMFEEVKADLERGLGKLLEARKGDVNSGAGKEGRRRLLVEALEGVKAPGVEAKDLM